MQVILSPDDRYLLTSVGDKVTFWDFESGKYFFRDESFDSKNLFGQSRSAPNTKFFVQHNPDTQSINICDIQSGEIIDLSGKIRKIIIFLFA